MGNDTLNNTHRTLAVALLAIVTVATACDRTAVGSTSHDQKAANNGVLIIESAPPQMQQQGCHKLIVWDDAAEAFYLDGNSVPTGYCEMHVGMKAIPMYEKARRERDLPPGSYRGLERKIKELEQRLGYE